MTYEEFRKQRSVEIEKADKATTELIRRILKHPIRKWDFSKHFYTEKPVPFSLYDDSRIFRDSAHLIPRISIQWLRTFHWPIYNRTNLILPKHLLNFEIKFMRSCFLVSIQTWTE